MRKLRLRISIWLVRLAKSIYPESQEANQFWTRVLTDQFVYGKSVIRIDPTELEEGL